MDLLLISAGKSMFKAAKVEQKPSRRSGGRADGKNNGRNTKAKSRKR
jgi:hypothetical protein